jgi:hypothetical protein
LLLVTAGALVELVDPHEPDPDANHHTVSRGFTNAQDVAIGAGERLYVVDSEQCGPDGTTGGIFTIDRWRDGAVDRQPLYCPAGFPKPSLQSPFGIAVVPPRPTTSSSTTTPSTTSTTTPPATTPPATIPPTPPTIPPPCGDGIVQPGEACDPGDVTTSCCGRDCRSVLPQGTVCRQAAGMVCRGDALCDGRSAECPANPAIFGLCNTGDRCTIKDACENGTCVPGPRACDLTASDYVAGGPGGGAARLPPIVVDCSSTTAGRCRGVRVEVSLSGAGARMRGGRRARDVVTMTRHHRPVRLAAGAHALITLVLSRAGIRLLRAHAGQPLPATVRATIENARDTFRPVRVISVRYVPPDL